MNIRFNCEAEEKLRSYIKEKEAKAVRLKVLARGCGKPALGIVIDEQKENDLVKVIDGIMFIVDKKEEEDFRNTEILYSPHYVNDGFYVRSFNK